SLTDVRAGLLMAIRLPSRDATTGGEGKATSGFPTSGFLERTSPVSMFHFRKMLVPAALTDLPSGEKNTLQYVPTSKFLISLPVEVSHTWISPKRVAATILPSAEKTTWLPIRSPYGQNNQPSCKWRAVLTLRGILRRHVPRGAERRRPVDTSL